MNRRILSVLTAILILGSVCSICFADGYDFMLSVTSDVSSVSKGDTFSVSFYANSIVESKGILSITATAKYDPSQLRYKGLRGLVPKDWGDEFFAEAFEAVEGSEKIITINMAYDGNTSFDEVAVSEDNQLGFELSFDVITATTGTATVSVLTEGLDATSASDLSVLNGLGESYSVSLNEVQTVVSEESKEEQSSFDITEEPTSEEEIVSSVASGDVSENDSEDFSDESVEESVESTEESKAESVESTEESKAESVESTEESKIESTESQEESDEKSVVASETSEESKDSNDKEGGLGVVFWIVISCVAVSIIAVVVYMLRFKKNDMNPVNPS